MKYCQHTLEILVLNQKGSFQAHAICWKYKANCKIRELFADLGLDWFFSFAVFPVICL